MIVPEIEASKAYKDNGAIVIWYDETEGGDTSAETLAEIVISPLAKGNAYTNNILYTHSSDLRTLEELFGVNAPGGGFLGDAANASDLSDLFAPGAIVPETPTWAMMLIGFAGLGAAAARRRKWAPAVSLADAL